MEVVFWTGLSGGSAEPSAGVGQHGINLASIRGEDGAGLANGVATRGSALQQLLEFAHVALRILGEVRIAGQAALDLVLHEAPFGQVAAALAEISAFPEVLGRPFLAPVVSDRPL